MNPLKCNDSLNSYSYPIIKVIIFAALIIIVLFVSTNRYRLFSINSELVNSILSIVFAVVFLLSVFCIYISFGELIVVSENRSKNMPVSDDMKTSGKHYSIDEIVALVQENDIIEIEILSKTERILLGSSADCKQGDSRFFDKRLYLQDTEFENINDFRAALLSYQTNDGFLVISIDGITG